MGTDAEADAEPHVRDDASRTGASARGGALARIGQPLRTPAFRWWFGAQVLSASGAMTQTVALSWLVLQRTHSAWWLGLVTVVTWVPLLLLGPWTGALADRADRRRILIATQTASVLLGLALALLAPLRPPLPVLLLPTALGGVVTAFDAPARQVYVVDLVGAGRIAGAVSLYEVTMNASRVLGPALGGVLLGTVGAWACFLANALAFAPPLAVLLAVRPATVTPASPARAPRVRGAVRDGLRYVRADPPIRACLPIAAASGTLFNLGVALPVFASRALHLGGGGYGALMAAFGLGALPGAVLAAGGGDPTGRQVRRLALATALLTLLLACSPNPPVAFAAVAAAGFVGIRFVTAANTLVQLRSTDAVRGRVMAAWSMALPGTLPVTGLLVSAAVQLGGPRAGLLLSAAALAATTLLGWRALRAGP
ncbi:MFS transporter [Kitasatospora phosalacinea]|uniref:MFS transporter n=1 Tax=Kitasatospora phosalacinea TaxID=2065 RepID=A0A9W6Q335_9ACTN|nr:MFS transporter [Kitasatospora phosalacinea]GLW68887.1 MFS transporter [Kitasatospora phosalacinea]